MYASRIGLGWLDPWELKARSVISGLLPAFLLIGFYPLTKAIRGFYRWVQRDTTLGERRFGGIMRMLGVPFFILFFAFVLFASEDNPWIQRFSFIWLGFWIIASLFDGENSKIYRFFSVVYVAVTGIVFLGSFIVVYAWFIFPDLPDEFGGPASECIVLDIDPSEYSKETINALIDLPRGDEGVVVRLKPIQLIVSTKDFIYLKIRDPNDKRIQFYQLRRSGVKHRSHCANAT